MTSFFFYGKGGFCVKKIASILMILVLLAGVLPTAMADNVIDPHEKRSIKPAKVTVNEMQEGISPTTGRVLEDVEQIEGFAGLAVTGRYMPMLVQIDNFSGGVTPTCTHWGVSYTDLIYETPLYSSGETRLSFLFSDQIPDSVGPVRSARLGHVWLREEWDAGFLYYGQQEAEKTNAKAEINKLGVWGKGLAFSGIVSAGKPWKKYYTTRAGMKSPHNMDGNVSAMYDLIDPDFQPRNHTFLFTEEQHQGELADTISINTGNKLYSSILTYDADSNLYYRFVGEEQTPYQDMDTGEQIGFSNVILQFTEVDYYGSDAPVTYVVGKKYFKRKGSNEISGNADYFIDGVHLKGCWGRESMESRTVFYTEDGQELQLQPGRTLIVVVDNDRWTVSYQ